MANNAGNTEVKAVLVETPANPKLTEVKVTLEPDKEFAQILYNSTADVLKIAFSLTENYENESVFKRDALHDGSVLFLKATCARCISQWDSLITKMSKLQKYSAMGRPAVDMALQIHPRYKDMWELCRKATLIKAQLK